MHNLKNPNKIEVYSEARRARVYVGELYFEPKTECFIFEYDRQYLNSKSAIPLGPDLPLRKRIHTSKKKQLFASFEDRIPSKENPAYEEYCRDQGIDPGERNEILLLGTIGRKGPSTFIFEPLYQETPISEMVLAFRNQLGLTVREFSSIFDINYPTLNKIETGKSKDKNTANLIRTYLMIPEAGLWRINLNQRKVHSEIAQKLIAHFKQKVKERKTQMSFKF